MSDYDDMRREDMKLDARQEAEHEDWERSPEGVLADLTCQDLAEALGVGEEGADEVVQALYEALHKTDDAEQVERLREALAHTRSMMLSYATGISERDQ